MEQAEAKFWAAYRIVLKKIKSSKHEELAMLATILIMQHLELKK
jgi:hypothetical protein